MSADLIYNDQKFASKAAQEDFYERTAHMTPEDREKLYDLMGRVSSFLSYQKILTLEQALYHIREHEQYERTEGEAWRQAQQAARDASIPKKPTGRPPKPKLVSAGEKRIVMEKWRDAVAQAKIHKDKMDLEVEAEIAELKKQIEALRQKRREFHEKCDEYVAACRAEKDALR